MAADTLAFLERVVGGPASLLGHSDGAVVALLAALRCRTWSGGSSSAPACSTTPAGPRGPSTWTAAATTAFFAAFWGAVAPDGPAHFPVVVAKLDRTHREEPTLTPADLAGYPGPALLMAGDGDDEIPLAHTLALRAGLPDAQLAVVPGTGHGFLGDKPDLCNRIVIDFLTEARAGGR